jgi:methylenetetrahydrofolate dehydrogenase (NADP+) / methenyltetrahydrofolate cyclohydrolase
MTADIIDGKAIAAAVRAEVARDCEELSKQGVTPGLATVLVGDDPASHIYVRTKRKNSAEVGIKSWDHDLPAETSQEELLELLDKLNHDPAVHGILVQIPLPDHVDEQTILDAVSPDKDADGFHPYNLGRLLSGNPVVAPATPAGIQELLLRSGVETSGAELVIVGRSNIVGKPMGALMVQKAAGANSTVTICHTRTKDLAAHTRRADILIAAVGRAHSITADMVKEGAVVIDVGMNRTEDGLVGDVEFEEVREVASAITPVPGGVGPMTIAMLLSNVVAQTKRSLT